jgi:hypothetical protein
MDYDARDVYTGQAPCKGFKVEHQGSTGACAFFATVSAFSARMCIAHGRDSPLSNVLLSIRHFADCSSTNWNVYTDINVNKLAKPQPWLTESWCRPYKAAVGSCQDFCPTGRFFNAVAGTGRVVYGIPNMQAEILRNGPVVARMQVPFTTGIWAYRSGVLVETTAEPNPPYHGVVVIGWGALNGIPYWLCQNSWGVEWGERGFFKLAHGSLNIEASGFAAIKPEQPLLCPDTACSVWGRVRNDCACDCNGTMRTGPNCEVCPVGICKNGGVTNGLACSHCICPTGFSGQYCQHRVFSAWRSQAYCSDGLTSVSWSAAYSFSSSPGAPQTVPPMGTSFIAFYTPDKVEAGKASGFSAEKAICTTSGSLPCAPTGTIWLTLPKTPGKYLIYQMNYQPGGFYAPKASQNTLIGYYTVLKNSTACTPAALAAAVAAYGPSQLIDAAAVATALEQTAMLRRLTDSAPALAAVTSWDDPVATLTLRNTYNSPDPVHHIWQGGRPDSYTICYTDSPIVSVAERYLALLIVGTADTELRPAIQYNFSSIQGAPDMAGGPCFTLRLGAKIPLQTDAFTIGLINSRTSATIAKTSQFRLMLATLVCDLTANPRLPNVNLAKFMMSATYRDPHPNAGHLDIVRAYEVKKPDVQVDWCYIYCRNNDLTAACCKTPPPDTTLPVQTGATRAFVFILPRTPGTAKNLVYNIQLSPGNSNGLSTLVVASLTTTNV